MADNGLKRRRDSEGADAADNKATKRRQKLRHRQLDGDELKLLKLYEDLAAESDNVRLEAAKQLIMRFSPDADPAPSAEAVEKALNRIIRGLCSQRKAARVGFCVTLTELLRQLFGSSGKKIEGFNVDVKTLIGLVEEKTKVEGNVPGQERRDHLIGKLFGYKAMMQSSILLEPEFSPECWNTVLDHIYGMARDVPWLREECGLILVEAVKSLKDHSDGSTAVSDLVQRLDTFKLTNTPEGVAIWLAARADFKDVLPSNVWHHDDPLSKKERSRLAKILKEDFRSVSQDGKEEAIKSAAANPNPIFAWDLVLSEILRRDEEAKAKKKDSAKTDFPQFWLDTVDGNLLSSSSSHEKKLWGIKLFTTLINAIPDWAIPALFSPNLMRTLINQSRKGDRFLHAAALAALKGVQHRVQRQGEAALPIFEAMTTKNGTIEFDKLTQTKTLEQILLSTDDDTLRELVGHLRSLVLRPDTQDQATAASRRQTIADLLLNTVKQYKHYDSDVFSSGDELDNWLRTVFDVLIEHAYFIPTESAKTSKVPLPPITDATRKIFQERLASCLTRLLKVDTASRSSFAKLIIDIIRKKATSSKHLTLLFKAEKLVMKTIDDAFQSLDAIAAKKSKSKKKSTSEGLVLLYSVALLQVFEGDTDAVMLLEELDAARKSLDTKSKTSSEDQSPFVEIILSFLGNPRVLFRNIAQDAFGVFAADITAEGLQSLTELLDTPENENGQKELFAQGDEDAEEAGSGSEDDDEDASDVEMVDGEDKAENDSADDSDSDSADADEDDEELTAFDNLLAQTLQTSRANVDPDAQDDSSEESDMDDDQMMALDPHLAKIFKERSKVTNKKKQRQDAKQTVVQFKSRVLDLLSIYLEKQYSNPLSIEVLLPLLRRIRTGANNPLTKKIDGVVKAYTVTRKNRKTPLPTPTDVYHVWKTLDSIHEEMKLGGSSIHATACSNASLHLVKILVKLDKANYAKVVDVYAAIQKEWFMEKKSKIHPVLFTAFQTWSTSMMLGGIPLMGNLSMLCHGIISHHCRSFDDVVVLALLSSLSFLRLPNGNRYTVLNQSNDLAERSVQDINHKMLNISFRGGANSKCHTEKMACTHINAPGKGPRPPPRSCKLRAPGPTQSVYREDCTQCFDSIVRFNPRASDDPTGLDVCLYCFNGGCTGENNHSLLHVSSRQHPLVLNIKRTRKKVKRDEPPQKMSKLAIAAETEADRYDTTTQVKCYECGVEDVDDQSGKLSEVVAAVLKANTFARQEEVKAWEQELTACEHTLCLEQETSRQIESQNLGHCSACDLKENLWLCLTCGNLGCGRAQFGGVGGNSHGLAHTQTTNHPVAVKLGSLTADGTADIYCYACDEERVDPELPNHLSHWGINIKDRIKTEKSLTEMQVEQNLLWEFSMTTEDGKDLRPLFGAGFTGLKNLGNSCYLASILQSLFSFPEFADRYYLPRQSAPETPNPAEDLETQLRKVADGLLSGKYSKPDSDVFVSEQTPENHHQKGLAPAMLKHLIGRGHAEFSTMRQQDAFELLLHLLKIVSRSQHVAPQKDPVDAFRFVMEQRLQCTNCKKVRYRTDEQENISIPVPIRRVPKDQSMDVTDSSGKEKEKEEFEPVTLKECLDIFTADELVELTCASCKSNAGFTKKSMFKTFPAVLAVNARRFELVNWVPTKQDVPVIVDDEPFSFDAYKSHGLQENEEELPEDADAGAGASSKWIPNEGALSMLEAMGFPRVRCEKALHATGNADPEAASNWLFAHMEDPDIDTPVDFNAGSGSTGGAASAIDPEKIESLGAMGFSAPQARQALRETGGDMERAVDWLFSHPDAAGDFDDGTNTETAAEPGERVLPGSETLPANFQLQSIVCHKGTSIHAGHYVAFVRKQIPGEQSVSWVLFNDEKVAKAADIDEMKKFAYVYFFRRL
ncbi:hypothetical protein BU24DRAFT_352794 [Aaosphaeria arxii CBS 175.79]|uniref:Ubiquitin carboxyl-terminal hydrolase 14 n=1 Tax=Aaosphaeria arxii CBS 175.79 TaxID=1450172 RepID=A0A6A5XGA9_9PLEO|nr:uncharacterized protein BU24DRAFT_352794 [Aaosphaeria arxii CBS 175.79]KAF2012208.1 hypothetical protein BU24DRAFT_352794 [Aaosphaeria arxii CBS 175.79]